MTQSAFPSKVVSPVVSGIYERPRIYKILDEDISKNIIWISGPAGSGKTTTTSAYLSQKKTGYSYYQIDDSDGDIASLFLNLKLSVHCSGFGHVKELPSFSPEYALGLQVFCRRFFTTLFSELPRGFAIVFDNFQELPDDPVVRSVFFHMLEAQPKEIRLFFVSRSEPFPEFAKYRLNNKTVQVTWEQLRLNKTEAKGVIRSRDGVGVSKQLFELFYQRSDGWMAGLILLAEGARQTGVELDLSEESYVGYTFDYLSGELFQHFDLEKQDFLLKSALVDKMPVKLVSELTGYDAQSILPALKKNNYFIESRVGQETIYQYHPLFRSFLLKKAGELLPEKTVQDLSCKAAQLLESEGRIDESLRLLFGIRDWDGMIQLVLRYAVLFLQQSQWKTLEDWIVKIPSSITLSFPWINYWLGVCRLPVNPSLAREGFLTAYESLSENDDLSTRLLIISGILEATFMEGHDFSVLDQWIDAVDAIMLDYPDFPAAEIENRIVPIMFGVLVNRRPDHPQFNEWLEKTHQVLLRDPDETLKVSAGFNLCSQYLYVGDFSSIGYVVDTLRRQIEGGVAHPLKIILIRMAAAGRFWLTGFPEEACNETEEALAFADHHGIYIWNAHFLGFGAAGALTGGNLTLARRYLDRMAKEMIPGMNYTVAMFHCISCWYYLLADDVVQAEEHANTAVTLAEELGVAIALAVGYQSMILCRYSKKDFSGTMPLIQAALNLATRMKSPLIEFQSLCSLAIIQFENGDRDEALPTLKRAMAIGRRENLLNFWIFIPDMMTRLCLEALEHGIEPEYIGKLISHRGLKPEHPPVDVENWPWRIRFHTLGPFRFEIDGKRQRFEGKPPKKPLEMLELIVTLGGRDIEESKIIDVLWPEADGDAGHVSFETTLHRLRKLIGLDQCLIMSEKRLSLNPYMCLIDYQIFETLDQTIEAVASPNKGGETASNEIELLERSIQIYQGHYFSNEAWALPLKEHLSHIYIKQVIHLGNLLESEGDYQRAVDRYLKGLRIDPDAEELYKSLMLCYLSRNLYGEAERTFKRYYQTMEKSKLPVSDEMIGLHHRINQSAKQ